MDDDLVLNLVTEVESGSQKHVPGRKGGRWTDRLVINPRYIFAFVVLSANLQCEGQPRSKTQGKTGRIETH